MEIVIDENIRDRYDVDIGSTMVVRAARTAEDAIAQFPLGPVARRRRADFTSPLEVVGIAQGDSADRRARAPRSRPASPTSTADRIVGPTNMFVTLRGGEAQFEQFQQPRAGDHGPSRQRRAGLGAPRAPPDRQHRRHRAQRPAAVRASPRCSSAACLSGRRWFARSRPAPPTPPRGGRSAPSRSMLVRGMVLPTWSWSAWSARHERRRCARCCHRASRSARIRQYRARHRCTTPTGRAAARVRARPRRRRVRRRGVDGLVADRTRTRAAPRSHRPWGTGRRVRACRRRSSSGARLGGRAGTRPARRAGALGAGRCHCGRARRGRVLHVPGRHRRRARAAAAIRHRVGLVLGELRRADRPRRRIDAVAGRSEGAGRASKRRGCGPSTSTACRRRLFGIAPVEGRHAPRRAAGRAPRRAGRDRVRAHARCRSLGVKIGDRVTVGDDARTDAPRVVGTALLPETSHTAYDQSALDDAATPSTRSSPPSPPAGPEDVWDFALVRWAPGRRPRARRCSGSSGATSYFVESAHAPGVGERAAPAARAAVRRSRCSSGCSRSRPSRTRWSPRCAAAATTSRSCGRSASRHVSRASPSRGRRRCSPSRGWSIGVPLGIIAGRAIWRWLAETFPIVYVPPLALVVVLLVVPAALLVVNAIAVAPGRAAAPHPPRRRRSACE